MSSRSTRRSQLRQNRDRSRTGRREVMRTPRHAQIAQDQPPSRTAPTRARRDQANWDREMNRLRTVSLLLGFTLLTVAARMIIDGVTPLSGMTAALMIVLLVASLLLRRRGTRLRPGADRNDPPGPR